MKDVRPASEIFKYVRNQIKFILTKTKKDYKVKSRAYGK